MTKSENWKNDANGQRSPPLHTGIAAKCNGTYEAIQPEESLFLLFIAPPATGCTATSLQKAASGESGFYPMYIGTSGNFSNQRTAFEKELHCLQREYDGEDPVLCATKEFMRKGRGDFWVKTLTKIFNFPYNNGRMFFPSSSSNDKCQSSDGTKEAISASNYFTTNSSVKFKNKEQSVLEADGFVRAHIFLDKTSTKPVVTQVSLSFPNTGNSATKEDVVDYDGPVVFDRNHNTSEVVIGLKEDSEDENIEIFKISLNKFGSSRRKRMLSFLQHTVKVGDKRVYKTPAEIEKIFNGWEESINSLDTGSPQKLDDPNILFSRNHAIRNQYIACKDWESDPRKPCDFAIYREEKGSGQAVIKGKEEYWITEAETDEPSEPLKAFFFPIADHWNPKSNRDDSKKEFKADRNIIGWTDLPRLPKDADPVFAFTGGMNGCSLLAMKLKSETDNTEDTTRFRVFHVKSPGTVKGVDEANKQRWEENKQKIESREVMYSHACQAREFTDATVEILGKVYQQHKTIPRDENVLEAWTSAVDRAHAAKELARVARDNAKNAISAYEQGEEYKGKSVLDSATKASKSINELYDAVNEWKEKIADHSVVDVEEELTELVTTVTTAAKWGQTALSCAKLAACTDQELKKVKEQQNRMGIEIYIDVIKEDTQIFGTDPEISTLTWQEYGEERLESFSSTNFLHFKEGQWWYYYQLYADTVRHFFPNQCFDDISHS